MDQRQSERDIRIQKAQTLRSIGINPYAQSWDKNTNISELLSSFGTKQSESEVPRDTFTSFNKSTMDPSLHSGGLRTIEDIIASPTKQISIAGRIVLKRVSGKLAFGQIMDETGQIQLMWEHRSTILLGQSSGRHPEAKGNGAEGSTLDSNGSFASSGGQEFQTPQELQQQLMGESTKPFDYWFVDKLLDVGDIIGVKGELFVTHKGELTVFVSEYQLLSKAIRPLGDKFHGIGEDNQETAHRQRYLDMIFNRESLERMKFRSHFIRTLREFYWMHDFLEIDCPVLTAAASGAAAKPFVTHHNDFDRDYYLRICNETELKKATIGGMEKVFTIATNFRNEGSDPSHLQEFVMLEHQNVYRSYHEDMDFTQKMFDHVFDTLKIPRKFAVKDKNGLSKEVDFTTPWPKIDYVEGVNKASGLDITSYSIDDADRLKSDIKAKNIEFEGMDQMGTMTLIDYLYKKVLRPSIIGPVFIYNYPSIIAPLARISDEDPRKCEKWQVVVNGREIINSYGELVDPIRQMENFEEQSKAEASGDDEATSADTEFVKAMEYGMPIQAGFGMGVDRIIALITQQDNLRDVVMFPLMKPEYKKTTAATPVNDEIINDTIATPTQNQSEINHHTTTTDIDVSIAEVLLAKYAGDTLTHNQQVGRIMRGFAQQLALSTQEQDKRYVTGLLHDIDRDHISKNASKHLQDEFVQIIGELPYPDDFKADLIQDIRTHYPDGTGQQPQTLIQQYLISIDELSGLLYAYSLMRPTGFDGMDTKGITKRIKDKSFASGVDRTHVRNCENYLDIPLTEFAMQVVGMMR